MTEHHTTTKRRLWQVVGLTVTAVLLLSALAPPALADPYPPYWDDGSGDAVEFAPAPWPAEPAEPADCNQTCGDWLPYTYLGDSMHDPRTQDPSNGGTSPQNACHSAQPATGRPAIAVWQPPVLPAPCALPSASARGGPLAPG